MSFTAPKPKAIDYRYKIGFKQHNTVLTKEQSLISKLTKLFLN